MLNPRQQLRIFKIVTRLDTTLVCVIITTFHHHKTAGKAKQNLFKSHQGDLRKQQGRNGRQHKEIDKNLSPKCQPIDMQIINRNSIENCHLRQYKSQFQFKF